MKLIYTKSVTKDVQKIKDVRLIAKVIAVIEQMKAVSDLKELKSLKKLSGHPSAYRIRIGNYRLGFYHENDTLILARLLKRSDIYKVFPQ